MTTITGSGITRFQLVALRGAVKLEAAGMTRRGRSATVIAKEQFGMPRSATRDAVIARITTAINEFDGVQA